MAVVDKVRFTISVPKAMFKELDRIKQESYYNVPRTSMLTALLHMGIQKYDEDRGRSKDSNPEG